MENKFFLFSSKDSDLEKFITLNGGIVTYDTSVEFDVAVFTPGEDISPFLYGEKRLKRTNSNVIRDIRENAFYRRLPTNAPKIGIGRGAQFLNVMAGGKLYQHVTGHAGPHTILDLIDGNEMQVTSFHHQEMILPDFADLLVVANNADKKESADGQINYDLIGNRKAKSYHDTEVAYLSPIKALLFQPRPEKDSTSVFGKNTKNLFMSYYESWILPESKHMYRMHS